MTGTSPRPSAPAVPSAARLRPSDLAGLASIGLRTRKLRAGLSALGIAIGVAAIVAVLGLAASAQQGLLAEIARLGTNLLTVTNGQTFSGTTAELPVTAPGMIDRLPGVTDVQDTGTVSGVNAYKSPLIPKIETNAISVDAATLGLPAASGTSIAQGRFLNAATARDPVVVLGAEAAQLLGIDRVRPGMRIWIGLGGPSGQWFYVTGILNPDRYASQIDSAVLIGFQAAQKYLHFNGNPSEIYVRTTDTQAVVTRVDSQLGEQANPENPSQVNVSRPSDVLTARAETEGALDTLFLGLGAVALLVGAIGVANIMIISVLERRQEIGLRRALGATRSQIRAQFLAEAILLALAGGTTGVILGAAAVSAYARTHAEAAVIPAEAWAGGLGAAVVIGAMAGLLPAIRAARLSPTQALHHPLSLLRYAGRTVLADWLDLRTIPSMRTRRRKVHEGHPCRPGGQARSSEVCAGRCDRCTSRLHRTVILLTLSCRSRMHRVRLRPWPGCSHSAEQCRESHHRFYRRHAGVWTSG